MHFGGNTRRSAITGIGDGEMVHLLHHSNLQKTPDLDQLLSNDDDAFTDASLTD
jgi:hypothetical protein